MITVLLPAYNEEDSLPNLMPKLRDTLEAMNVPYRVVVCNDGSKDRTAEMLEEYARQMPVEVITHRINRGLGETSRDLFEYAAETCAPDDVIIRMDCDDTHEPQYIPALKAKLDEGYDVVIASRFEPGGGQMGLDWYRTFISRGANMFMKVLFPIPGLKEYSCGFRAYRARRIRTAVRLLGNGFIQLKGLGFTCTLEKVVKLKLLGSKFGEVPFCLRYDQKQSASKMVGSVTTLGYLVMALMYHWPWGGWRVQYRELARRAAELEAAE